MSKAWKLADAKNQLSEVLNLTLKTGEQEITRRNDRFVVLSYERYQQLRGNRPTLKSLLVSVPNMDGIDLSRQDPEPSSRNIQF